MKDGYNRKMYCNKREETFRMLQKYMRRPELIILGIILVIGLIFRLMTLKHMVVI